MVYLLGVFGFCIYIASAGREVECRFLAFHGGSPSLLGLSPTGEQSPIDIAAEEISAPVKYMTDDSNRLIFTNSKDPKKVVAEVALPASAQSVILVFIPTATEESLPWKVMVIEDSVAHFPDGGAFVVNLQPQDIRFTIGEIKLMLKSGSAHAIPKPKKVDDFNMAYTQFEFFKNEKWSIASESVQRFIPGLRYLMFCYLDHKSGRARVETYLVR